MRKLTIALLAAAGLSIAGSALADLSILDGGGASRTIKNFVCETTKLCNATVLIKSDGTEIGTSSNPVRTDPTGGTTQPVSGTVTANLGTLNGAATAAKQPALGTAGSPSSDVITVQGNGSGTPLPVSSATLATAANQSTANTSIGATNESAAGSDTATSGLNGLIKRLLQSITTLNGKIDTLNTNVTASIPAGPYSIGTVGADPSKGGATPASVAINVSTATTTQLVALSGSTKIYVTSFDVIAGGTGNITFVYGTGSNCGTGTTSLTGAYNLTAQAGIAKGNGVGAVLVVPAGNALCVTTSAAVQMSGSISYQQL